MRYHPTQNHNLIRLLKFAVLCGGSHRERENARMGGPPSTDSTPRPNWPSTFSKNEKPQMDPAPFFAWQLARRQPIFWVELCLFINLNRRPIQEPAGISLNRRTGKLLVNT